MIYLRVFMRGFVLVTLTAMNVRQVSQGHYGGAFVIGGLISLVWWQNSSKDRPDVRGAGIAYAVGAACGTVLGMALVR